MSKASLVAVLVVLCAMASAGLPALGDTAVLAQSGWASPYSNADYDSFTNPVLNHFGNVAFRTQLTGVTVSVDRDQALCRVGSSGPTRICREGDTMPDGNGTVFALSTPAMNNTGDVVYRADATGTALGAYDSVGIYRSGGGAPTQLVRGNDPAPDGNGRFLVMSETPLIDDDVVTTFWSSFTGTSGGFNDDTAVIVEGWGARRIYARENQLVPGGDGRFSGFRSISENDNQTVGFLGDMRGTSLGSDNNTALYRANLSGFSASLTELVREGDTAPDGNGTFRSFSPSATVDKIGNGRIAFHAWLNGTAGGVDDDSGIFMGTDTGVFRVAREGQAPPGGNGTYSNFDSAIAQNETYVAFRAFMKNTTGGALDDEGVYKGNGIVTHEICRGGIAAPDADGAFNSMYDLVMNKPGHVAFTATLTGTARDKGLFIGDGFDTVQVARTGDPLLGSTITDLEMATGADCRNGMNDLTQVAYRATLANGKQALVLFTPEIKWKGGNGGWYTKDHWTLGILPDEHYEIKIEPAHGPLEITGPDADETVRSLSINSLNAGPASLNLNNGGGLTVLGNAAIGAKGRILLGRDRTLSAGALLNEGVVEFEGGTAQVFGPLTNDPLGQVQIPTGTVAYFRGPVVNHGMIHAEINATVNFSGLKGKGLAGGGKAHLDGLIEPGDGVGQMDFEGKVMFGPRSLTRIELSDFVPGGQHDMIGVAGDCDLGGGLEAVLVAPFMLTPWQTYEILDIGGAATGQFDGLGEGARVNPPGGPGLFITYAGGDGNDVALYTVPEPTTIALLALGGLLALSRRRRRPRP